MRKSLIKICVIYVLVLSLTIANSKYIIMDIGNDPYATSGSLITSNEYSSSSEEVTYRILFIYLYKSFWSNIEFL